MPYSIKQKGAACAELGRRKKGIGTSKDSKRPFAGASHQALVDFCTGTIEKKRAKK